MTVCAEGREAFWNCICFDAIPFGWVHALRQAKNLPKKLYSAPQKWYAIIYREKLWIRKSESMELLKERIRKDGVIKAGNVLKVDNFLNHQMDIALFNEIGKEFKRRFADVKVDRILTIEASGIGIAAVAAQYFQVPVVFAKKAQSINLDGDMLSAQIESFTHKRRYEVIVASRFLNPGENVLIIDDFLANGCAALGLCEIIQKAHANVAGIGIVIEKGFQQGGKLLREKGLRVESLAIVDGMDADTQTVQFRD